MFAFFERLVDPYPDAPPATPPRGFFAFLWACTHGLREYLVALTVLSAASARSRPSCSPCWATSSTGSPRSSRRSCGRRSARTCCCSAACSPAACSLIALQSTIKQQALFGNFPMLLRWNFHRLMLGQSMGFYQDEFAGRIATKVMQTALAVRDTWLIVAELLVFVVIYFVDAARGAGRLRRAGSLVPFLGWLALYVVALRFFVPRLGRVAQRAGRRALADDRAHHRRLHQHRHGQAVLARAARGRLTRAARCRSSSAPCTRQMRLVTGFEIVNHALSAWR